MFASRQDGTDPQHRYVSLHTLAAASCGDDIRWQPTHCASYADHAYSPQRAGPLRPDSRFDLFALSSLSISYQAMSSPTPPNPNPSPRLPDGAGAGRINPALAETSPISTTAGAGSPGAALSDSNSGSK